MLKIREIAPPQKTPAPVDSGEWQIVKPLEQIVINDKTGCIEWSATMGEQDFLNVQKILKVQKLNRAKVLEIYRFIRDGKSLAKIVEVNRKEKGYSEATVKRYSTALSIVFKWKRGITVSKNK